MNTERVFKGSAKERLRSNLCFRKTDWGLALFPATRFLESFYAFETLHYWTLTCCASFCFETWMLRHNKNCTWVWGRKLGGSLEICNWKFTFFTDLSPIFRAVREFSIKNHTVRQIFIQNYQDLQNLNQTAIWFLVNSHSGSEALLYFAAITAVPEPSSAALLGLGSVALLLRRRR